LNIYDSYIHPTQIRVGNFNNLKIIKFMATSQEVFEQIQELFVSFEENHNGTTKAAKSRARKHIGEIKKLVTDYRKLSVEESK
jgi:hypothetical protein|tara:strand:+ start:596 stop:844 length:249 start_codon:yes stop_codon:yes gene_type:complete